MWQEYESRERMRAREQKRVNEKENESDSRHVPNFRTASSQSGGNTNQLGSLKNPETQTVVSSAHLRLLSGTKL